jgi:sarcosine oxidase delta subunit
VGKLKPLNPATCPYCGGKKTARGGFLKGKRASVWKCRNPECGKEFLVRFLFLKPNPT